MGASLAWCDSNTVSAYMLLCGYSIAFEYLVNFELGDLIGSLSQMDIQIFIERECEAVYTSPGKTSTWAALSFSYLVLSPYLCRTKGKKSSPPSTHLLST